MSILGTLLSIWLVIPVLSPLRGPPVYLTWLTGSSSGPELVEWGWGLVRLIFLPPSREMHDEQSAAKLAKASWGFRTPEDVLFMVSRFSAGPASLLAWGMGDVLTPPPFWFLRAYYLFLMVTFSSQLDLAWNYPREPPLGNRLHHTGLCSRLWGFFLIAC